MIVWRRPSGWYRQHKIWDNCKKWDSTKYGISKFLWILLKKWKKFRKVAIERRWKLIYWHGQKFRILQFAKNWIFSHIKKKFVKKISHYERKSPLEYWQIKTFSCFLKKSFKNWSDKMIAKNGINQLPPSDTPLDGEHPSKVYSTSKSILCYDWRQICDFCSKFWEP